MDNLKFFELLTDYDGFERRNVFEKLLPDNYKNPIISNINKKYKLRTYQEKAFNRFIYHIVEDKEGRKKPTQLLFQMATGSGKTLIMAGCILYLYKLGYRNFIYFVNNTNIIDKTRDNFLNSVSNKYLFNEIIQFGDKSVRVKEVNNFQGATGEDIYIHFTTTQGLHSHMNTPRENSVTYEDFENLKVVLLSDEAHHMNVETKRAQKKRLNQSEFEIFDSWETTVMRIFRANEDNLLLEFTATVEFQEPTVAKKYKDKLIYDYKLLNYYLDKYSKEVQVLQSNLNRLDRAIQALIISQYRQMVFSDHNLLIKPVVMFKANYVNKPTQPGPEKIVSSEFRDLFRQKIESLSVEDLERIRNNAFENEDAIIVQKAFEYFDKHDTSIENLVLQLREAFSDEKCISVDSSQDKQETQVIVNSLEDEGNFYRAVFAVEALNEGWDVLNLFDIVRLYDTRDARRGIPGRTTIKEAQLIGRGARYCPFQIEENQPIDQRKFDDDLQNPLRVCEELYYHITYDTRHRYISELKQALDMVGIKPLNVVKRELKLKDSFKASNFYRGGVLYLNEQVKNENSDVYEIPKQIRNKQFLFRLRTGYAVEESLMEESSNIQVDENAITKKLKLKDLGNAVLRKATQKLLFYEFSNLIKYYPHLKSITEFITSEKYISDIKVEITGRKDQLENIPVDNRLRFALEVLQKIALDIEKGNVDRFGTKIFKPNAIKNIFFDKELQFNISTDSTEEKGHPMSNPAVPGENFLDLSKEDWYAFNENYGTSEEKKLVKYIKAAYDKLNDRYNTIYLIRNERHFKLYNFDDERVIEPDFVLCLIEKEVKNQIIYQLFIEPKGKHLLEEDKWKEEFLIRVEQEYQLDKIFENRDVRIVGLPFYNKAEREEIFTDAFGRFVG